MHIYDVPPRKDHRGVDLISDALPFGRIWYGGENAISNAIGYAQHYSRSHGAPVVTVIGKVFWDIGHAPKDQSNRRSHQSGYAAWEIHPVMALQVVQ